LDEFFALRGFQKEDNKDYYKLRPVGDFIIGRGLVMSVADLRRGNSDETSIPASEQTEGPTCKQDRGWSEYWGKAKGEILQI